jgi:hypothetical protein
MVRAEYQMLRFPLSHKGPPEATDPVATAFDNVLLGRVESAIEAIWAARSAIRKCRQERIETYLLRKEVHLKVCQLREQVARARSLTLIRH